VLDLDEVPVPFLLGGTLATEAVVRLAGCQDPTAPRATFGRKWQFVVHEEESARRCATSCVTSAVSARTADGSKGRIVVPRELAPRRMMIPA
jgi:hypothetical protein